MFVFVSALFLALWLVPTKRVEIGVVACLYSIWEFSTRGRIVDRIASVEVGVEVGVMLGVCSMAYYVV